VTEQHLSSVNTDTEIPSKSKWVVPFVLLAFVVIVDQVLKYWVKNNMILHTERSIIGDWFLFHFTENNGMAFGMEFFGVVGKYILTILRIVVSSFGIWFLYTNIKKNANFWFLVCIALILGGAIGNIIDSVFYGVIYQHMNEYTGLWLQGRVVDMLYFPVIHTHYPEWSPINAGQEFIFFSPVFNLADTAISIGIISILVFQKRFFKKQLEGQDNKPTVTENTMANNDEITPDETTHNEPENNSNPD
jgi:signal peptidase II